MRIGSRRRLLCRLDYGNVNYYWLISFYLSVSRGFVKRASWSDLYLSRRRLRKRLNRLRKEAGKRRRTAKRDRARQTRPWPLARHLGEWLPARSVRREELTITIPSDFSVLRDPAGVVTAVKSVCRVAHSHHPPGIFFDHSNLAKFDLPAEAVLDVVTREVRNRLLRRGIRMRLGGRFPADPAAQRFIRGIGISRHLDIPDAALPAGEEEKLHTFQQHKRTPTPKDAPAHTDEKSRATVAFVDFIDGCLKRVGRKLTIVGRQRLCDYTGEIIDNIEQHADTNFWYIAGYLDTSTLRPTCEIAIFNFGRTFAQTFTDLEEEAYPRAQVAPYVQKHRRSQWFGSGWDEEDLYTLAAMQGGISSKARSDADGRGQGTIDLIRFFQGMHAEYGGGEEPPEMVVWSGHTHLVFNGKYQLAQGDGGRWTIAFNDTNSLSEKPDSNCVKHLTDAYFPGALIGIKFTIPPSQTTLVASSGTRHPNGN